MKRVRLTQRRRDAAEFVDYPGTVNQPDRTFRADDEYENEDSWMVDGWELQDLPTRFDDKRDEENIPLQTTEPSQSRKAKVAATRNAASKAVRLAMLLLGDKVSEKVIEGQAHDFMRLGSECLTNALKRYAGTEKLYAKKSEDEEVEAEDEEVEEEVVETGAKKKKKSDDDEDEDDEVEVVETGAKKKKKSEDEPKRAGELDIEMTAAEGEVVMSSDEREILASLYADSEPMQASDDEDEDDEDEIEVEVEAKSKKAGVQKLGGQPKVASRGGEVDLGNLWKDAPDLSSVFSS